MRRLFWPIVIAAVAAGVVACGRGLPPPPPTSTRVPTNIGVIVKWETVGCRPGRYWLDSGAVFDVYAPGTDPKDICDDIAVKDVQRLSDTDIGLDGKAGEPVAQGYLVFYGEDDNGRFYAAAAPGRSELCPYEIQGAAYETLDAFHFSSGLVIFKAPDFQIEDSTRMNDLPLRSHDTLCLNRQGQARGVRILPAM